MTWCGGSSVRDDLAQKEGAPQQLTTAARRKHWPALREGTTRKRGDAHVVNAARVASVLTNTVRPVRRR